MKFYSVCALVLALSLNPTPPVKPLPLLDGMIESSALLDLDFPVAGRISNLHFERGDKVTAGEIVAQLDSSVELAKLKIATLRAESSVAIKRAKVRYEQLEARRQRFKALLDLKKFSPDEYEAIAAEASIGKLLWQDAQEKQALDKFEVERLQRAIELRILRSPANGVVVSRGLGVGELVGAKDSTVLQMAILDPLNVELIIDVEHYGFIELGMLATITLELPTGSIQKVAKVVIIDPVFDAPTATFGVRLQVANPNNELPAGLRCKVQFHNDQ